MRHAGFAAVAAPLFASASFAQVPAAPQVTVGAELKVLRFDWEPVPEATYYQLHYKPSASAAFAPQGGVIAAPRTLSALTVPIHQFDWNGARYKVAACNELGCGISGEIAVTDLMITAIGYFKASNPDPWDGFGGDLVISDDGNTLVVNGLDDSAATGVNGSHGDDSTDLAGALYVYRRSGNGWKFEAYLKPAVTNERQFFGSGYPWGLLGVSVSADGSVIAAGAPGEQIGQSIGAAYVYGRAANGRWSLLDTLPSPSGEPLDLFGTSVDVSADASVIKVSGARPFESTTTWSEGRTYLYRRTGDDWALELTIPGAADDFCHGEMSADARTLLHLCWSDVNGPRVKTFKLQGGSWVRMADLTLPSYGWQSPAISFTGSRLAIRIGNASVEDFVNVYRWTGSQWLIEQTITRPPGDTWGSYRSFGEGLAFNRDGSTLAIGEPTNSNGGEGVVDELVPGPDPGVFGGPGAVFVYQRGTGSSPWALRKVVKASNPERNDSFGQAVALSGNGLTLAVGAPSEDSSARYIDGDQANNRRQSAGAVYLY